MKAIFLGYLSVVIAIVQASPLSKRALGITYTGNLKCGLANS